MGGLLCITAVTTFNTFFGDLGNVGQYLFSLAFIWFGVWAAILSFGVGKWIPTLGAWARIALLAFFTFSVDPLRVQARPARAGASASSRRRYALFIALVPLLFFNFVGFELPNAAGDEMKDPQKDVPFTVMRATIASVLLYGIPILAIIMVLPVRPDHRPRRLHRRHEVGLHRLRRRGRPRTARRSPAPARSSATSWPPASSSSCSRAARRG